MKLELWAKTAAAIGAVAAGWRKHARDEHSTVLIVRVHHWTCLHDPPVGWACRAVNWPRPTRPVKLPSQSAMSRRARRVDFMEFLGRVRRRMNGKPKPSLVKVLDGKPLELPNHTSDPDATRGRGASRTAARYKLHAIVEYLRMTIRPKWITTR